MIVPIASEPHHRAHLEPILAHLPYRETMRRAGPEDVALVASYGRGGLRGAVQRGYRRIILAQHGAGQSYGGDPGSNKYPSYPGGRNNDAASLFLVPNEHSAQRWRDAYPSTPVAVVGSPRLDTLPARSDGGGGSPPVVAISFHWEAAFVPEAGSAFRWFVGQLPELARRYKIIGHGHPLRKDLNRVYHRNGIEYVRSFDEVCRRADVYVCDNSSTLFEFASTGRPVVVMNAPIYRRSIHHGLRFWEAAHVGINVDQPAQLGIAIEAALSETPADAARREDALSRVYAYRSGAGERAASVIREFVGIEEAVAA